MGDSEDSGGGISIWTPFGLAIKGIFWLCVFVAPTLGVWFASSIAAYLGGPVWLACVSGLALFPGLPLLWDLWGRYKFEKKQRAREEELLPRREHILTFSDRLILRTMIVNLVFMSALLAAFPKKSFEAVAKRGDWIVDGVDGALADEVRTATSKGAGVLEWLYLLSFDNPYEELVKETKGPAPTPNEFGDKSGEADGEEPPEDGENGTDATDEEEAQVGAQPDADSHAGSDSDAGAPDAGPPDGAQGADAGTSVAAKQPKHPKRPKRPKVRIRHLDDESSGASGQGGPKSGGQKWPMRSRLHPLIKKMPAHVETSFESVAEYIRDRETEPFQRVKALNDYVAHRIAYDVPALRSRSFPPQDAKTVWQTKKGVCAGYANLLEAMGDAAGVEIVTVTGDIRRLDGTVPADGHAWNAAKIGGKWYLIDVTWNAGYVNGDTFTRKYKTDYLFAPPRVFGLDHFPRNRSWQLRSAPISRAEWLNEPTARPLFYAQGFDFIDPRRPQVDSGSTFEATFKNRRDRAMSATISPKRGGKKTRCDVEPGKTVRVSCPVRSGTNTVNLFVGRKGASSLSGAASIEVVRR